MKMNKRVLRGISGMILMLVASVATMFAPHSAYGQCGVTLQVNQNAGACNSFVSLSSTPTGTAQAWSYYLDGQLVSTNATAQITLSPGVYQAYVGVTMVGGCLATDLVTFTVAGQQVTLDAGADVLACQSQAVLGFSTDLQGNYSVNWSPTLGLSDPTSAAPLVTQNVYQQEYIVDLIATGTGCVYSDTVVVTQNNPLIDTYSLCNGPVTLDLGPGANFYQWLSWTDENGNNQPLNYPSTQQAITVNQPGQYFMYADFPDCGALTSLVTVEACVPTCFNAFTQNITTDPCGDIYSFVSTGTGQVTSWSWDFGDGTTANFPNPFHVFTTGTYEVTLTTTNSDGCTAVSSQTFTSSNGVSLTMSNDTVGCQEAAYMEVFPSGGSGNYSYSWTPNQGVFSDPTQPIYYVEGVHDQVYYAYVTDNVTGCVAYDSVRVSSYVAHNETLQLCNDSVYIDLGPGASFYNLAPLSFNQQQSYAWADTPGQYVVYAQFPSCGALTSVFTVEECSTCWNLFSYVTGSVQCGTEYQFVSTSSAQGVTYLWDLGDGSTSNQANPYHVYSAGTYTVTLTVVDVDQCTSVSTQTITVGGLSVQINGDTIACAGQLMLFCGTTGGSGNYAYNWAPTVLMASPTSQNTMMNVQGEQWVYVTVYDTQNQCSATDSVYIYPNQQINQTVELCTGGALLEVDPGSLIYNWTFTPAGGGTAVSLPNSTNTLTAFNLGTYSVMTYYSGCQQVFHTFAVVACSGTCTSSITATLSYLNCGALLDFTPNYSSPVDSVYWDYGNGNSMVDYGSGIQPMFYDGGNYIVQATVYHSNGCISTTSYGINLFTEVVAAISANDTVACAGQLFLSATATGGSGQYAYFWPFSGATTPTTVFAITQNQWIEVGVTDTYTGCTAYDSIYVYANTAMNETYELCTNDVLLTVDPGSMVYNWSFTDAFGNSTQLQNVDNDWLATEVGTYVCLSYYSGCQTVTHVFYVGECTSSTDDVWPGDANSDNIVTNADALYLGLAFNQNGPVRPAATLNWIGQPCPDWTFNFAVNDVNLKHADCDGNGIINFNDTLAINFNYLNTHNKFEGVNAGGNPPIWVEATPDTVGLGQYIDIVVHVGTAAQPVDSLHGVAFSLTFNESYLTQNGFTVDFDNCALGTAGTDVLTFQKNLFNDGMIDVAVSRNTLQNFQGYGPIAHARIVTTDNLSGIHELPIGISGVVALSNAETPVELTAIGDVVVIDPSKVGIDEIARLNVAVYPNPTRGIVSIVGAELSELQILNALGQVVFTTKIMSEQSTIDLSELNDGIYVLCIQNEHGLAVERLRIMK